jgi:integrase
MASTKESDHEAVRTGSERRRGHGEGAIYRDEARGRWVGQIDLGVWPGGKRRRPKVFGRTKTEVRARLDELRHSQASGLPVASSDRLGEHLGWWLANLEAKAASGDKSSNTVDNARWAVETWIKPALGGLRMRDLKPEDVEGLLAGMATAGRSRSSINRVRSYLGQALAVAERRGKVARNVARISEMPATRRPAARRTLTPEQAAKLLQAASGDRLEGLIVVGLMLGLRPGELTGMRWSDIDLDALRLSVEVSLKSERTGLRVGETKTPKSRRPLTLPQPVIEALRTQRKRQREDQLKAPGGAWRDTGHVFTTTIGTPLDPSNLRAAFDKITERAGLGHWTPNELRHSAASLLSAAGVPLEEIADVLGHTSKRMLEQHYRHQVKPSIDAHVNAMESLFG